MKKLLLLLLLPFASFAQEEYLDVLKYVYGQVAITPSGRIWIADDGYIYSTGTYGKPLQKGPLGTVDKFRLGEKVICFSEDVLLATDRRDSTAVYRSEDGGYTWVKMPFDGSLDITDIHKGSDGKAWMSIENGSIFYTADTGRTWARFKTPCNEPKQRFNNIHFAADNTTGFAVCGYESLILTKDNCQSWELLPTPVSQGKMEPGGHVFDRSLGKVRIWGRQFIIRQGDNVFITDSTSIDWRLIDNAVDFELTEDNHIYIINKDFTVDLKDSSLTTIWKSAQGFADMPKSLFVTDNTLYAFNRYQMYRISPEGFDMTYLPVKGTSVEPVRRQVAYNGSQFGFYDEFLLKRNEATGSWYRYMELPYHITSIAVYDGKFVAVVYPEDYHYVVDMDNRALSAFTYPEKLFENKKIKSLTLETQKDGKDISVLFVNNNGMLKSLSNLKNTPFAAMDNSISEEQLQKIVREADDGRDNEITLADLNISKKDIRHFKRKLSKDSRNIPDEIKEMYWAFRSFNKDFFSTAVDALDTLQPAIITRVFSDYTPTMPLVDAEYNTLEIEFEDGKKMVITSCNDFAGYHHTPLEINYDGLPFKSMSVKPGMLIDAMTKGTFLWKSRTSPLFALFQISDYIYRNRKE